jgi:hypothetical protein
MICVKSITDKLKQTPTSKNKPPRPHGNPKPPQPTAKYLKDCSDDRTTDIACEGA